MKTILHTSESRGHANHGWLDTYHTFSFAGYYDADRVHFGALRVLNDDTVAAGRGFGTHPHDNMEIVSIPLSGALRHNDSMGNEAVIRLGEVQVMSAGTGIYHSEYNHLNSEPAAFLQIWVFPNVKNVEPRYDQIAISDIATHNSFYQIVSPNPGEQGVWIHQQAWFHLGTFDKGTETEYSFKKSGNGLYVFVLEGEAEVGGQILNRRDGMGIMETERVHFKASSDARILLMEVPLQW
jgi:redox-sensitive bicupin YhaK (pirin superfamily)